jgi:hypothetical protein
MAPLRETLLPRAKQFHQLASDAIDGLRRQRQMPSVEVERAVPREIRLIAAGCGNQPAIEQALDVKSVTLSGLADYEPVCG